MNNSLMDTARKAARAGGQILTKHFGKVPSAAIRRKTKNDFLSFVDEQSEAAIISVIKRNFPDHAILAEESGARAESSTNLWIIDPLDGTKNYLSGIPVFAISIALMQKDELILGIIYDPLRDEMFTAQKGLGAYLNDRRIRVSQKSSLGDCLVATGFPFKAKQFLPPYLRTFEDIFNHSVGMRRMGAAAIDLAYLSCARFDAFWEIGLSPWDVAAGTVLVREAGGRVSDFWLGDRFLYGNYMLASNGLVHDEIATLIRRYFPKYRKVYQD